MSPTEQIANAFVTAFFEGLASDPVSLTEFYGHHAAITINDFEKGIVEAYDGDVRTSFQKWASILKGSQLSVETVNAAKIFSGLNVFVSFSAVNSGMRQYYHITTSLEVNPEDYTECYYIRHQIISRIGAVAVEAPAPVEEPAASAPAPVVEKAKHAKHAAKEEPAPAARAEPKKKTPEAEPVPEVAAPAAAPAPEEVPAPEPVVAERAAPAAASAGGKPKSWASLASAGAKAKITGEPMRVIAHDQTAKSAAAPAAAAPKAAAAAAPAAAATEAPVREHKREPRVHEPVGDCLMFNTKAAVSDEEIKSAIGAVASSLVSLRNNSATGRVFMDFAQGVHAFDEITKAAPTIGDEKIAVYRQRERAPRRD